MLGGGVKAIEENPSPKQLARRGLIVDAAVETLKRAGIAGCTVRAIAAATPFTKGTIHYYFKDVDEIVNTAYLRLTDDYVAAVDAVARGTTDPRLAFWRAIGAYVQGFRVHKRMGLLWFEYSAWAVRNGYEQGLASSVDAVRSMFGRRLAAVAPDAAPLAQPLTRYLVGTVLELAVSMVEPQAVLVEVSRICDIRPPRWGQVATPHDRTCPVCGTGR